MHNVDINITIARRIDIPLKEAAFFAFFIVFSLSFSWLYINAILKSDSLFYRSAHCQKQMQTNSFLQQLWKLQSSILCYLYQQEKYHKLFRKLHIYKLYAFCTFLQWTLCCIFLQFSEHRRHIFMLKINMNLCFINVYIYKLQSNNIF